MLQAMIGLIETSLGHMVASRALLGKQPDDSLAAVRAADDALLKAEKVDYADLTAQSFLWAGIAYFYDGQSQEAQEFIDEAGKLKGYLREDDRKVLDLWVKYGIDRRSVETRSNGYVNGLRAANFQGGGGRRRSSSTSITRSPNRGGPTRKKQNENNDIPEFDSGKYSITI